MTFDEYSAEVATTVQYMGTPQERLNYTSIALGGEVGEYLNEYKKYLRGNPNKYETPQGEERIHLLLELGDTLWYLARTAHELESSLEHVAQLNVTKLAARYSK